MAKKATTTAKTTTEPQPGLFKKIGEVLRRLVDERFDKVEGRLDALERPLDLDQVEKDLIEGFQKAPKK